MDGKRFLERLGKGRGAVHRNVIEEYEHLDVLWAIDRVEEVGWDVRDVWRIVEEEVERVRIGGARMGRSDGEEAKKGVGGLTGGEILLWRRG